MKYVIVLIMFLLLQVSSYADICTLDYNYMIKVNNGRMTTLEQNRVDRFTNMWALRNTGKQKEQILYDSIFQIIELTQYDSEVKKPSGVLNGYANCQGYSTMLQIMLTKCGIETNVIVSPTHMWNEVNINGKWRETDVTALDSFNFTRSVDYEK